MELYEKNKVMFMHVGPWVGIWKITWVLATPKVNGKRVIYMTLLKNHKEIAYF